jgi:hypothetical protein
MDPSICPRTSRRPTSRGSVSLFSVLKPVPELLDTTVLFSELRGLASTGRSPRLLTAAEQGEAILYISSNVEIEVEEKFQRIAATARVSVGTVRSAWHDRYSPYVRVIDGLPAEHDPRWRGLAGDDPEDLSFAEAVAVIGPILEFSEDTDLAGRGLATDQWRDVPALHWRMRAADYTIGAPPTITIILLAKAMTAARRHPEIALIVLLVLAFLFGPTRPEPLRWRNDRAKAIGRAATFGQILAMHADASAELTARLTLGSNGDETLSDVVAQLLQEREPVVFERLAARLSSRVSEDDLAGILGGKEFAQARAELKLGTPEALKQVLVEAACALESTMKVLLQQRKISYDPRDTAQKLFEHLRDNGVITADTERMVLACATPRNKRAGHGAGAVAHDVQQHEAEAFVAAAATAIVFLGKLLP